jgi:hypothetical protein
MGGGMEIQMIKVHSVLQDSRCCQRNGKGGSKILKMTTTEKIKIIFTS